MTFSFSLLGVGILLVLAQALAALPWLAAAFFNRDALRRWLLAPGTLVTTLTVGNPLLIAGGVLLVGTLSALLMGFVQDRDTLEGWGRIYAAALHLQLVVDLFILAFVVLLWVWPKGGAVALAAFREGVRHPMFWLLTVAAFVVMLLSPFVPYFTFGEDLVMVKEIGYDLVMLTAGLFGVLMASTSISEEIEGRTAITVMSKPVSRRQFLLGKYVGILLAALVMVGLLGWWFNWVVILKHWFDKMDPNPVPAAVTRAVDHLFPPGAAADYGRGIAVWVADTVENVPGFILGSCQVMVLLAVAVALATHLSMVVNLVICFLIYFLGHLSPVLSEIAKRKLKYNPTAPGNQMLDFMATLFKNVLPGLEFFSVGPALVTDSPPPLGEFYGYVGLVSVYAFLYTAVLLLVGLVLFENHDLA